MRIYRISFYNNGKLYQLHAEQVGQSEIPGFVEVSGLLFDTQTTVVIDPGEERLKTEFDGVERILLPMHSIVRMDQVRQQGKNRILDADGGNVMTFPGGRHGGGTP